MKSDDRRPTWRRFLLEAAVIIGSILAAFSVDRWWESRSEAHEEVAVLQALAKDFATAAQELAEVRRSHQTVAAAGVRLLAYESHGTIPADERAAVDSLVGRHFMRFVYDPPMGTLESLTGSGRLYRLTSQDLGAHLGQWSALVGSLQSLEYDARTHFYDYIYPYLATRLDLKDVDKGFAEFVELPWSQDPTEAYVLLGEREFRSIVYMHWVLQSNILQAFIPVERTLHRIQALINEQLPS